MQSAALHGSVPRGDAECANDHAGAQSGLAVPVLTIAVAVAIFIGDWFIELGVAIGVAYMLVVWLSDSIRRPRAVMAVAMLCSIFTVIGFLQSPGGGELWKILANRSLSLLAIWSTAYFVLQRRQAITAQRDLNLKLHELNDALTQSNIDLQQFAYVAAHDLQTPLRHISGFVQILQTEYEKKLDKDAREWIGLTIDGVEQMQTLIRNLLTFSRVESRSEPFQSVALDDVFDRAIEAFEGQEVTITKDPLPTVAGDESQLLHLLQNLIGNGVKYRSGEQATVHVSATNSGDKWLIAVRDNGIGIDPRHHERVFEVFRRLHTAQEYPGTGIGLAVCRRIVARHGGRIWVESEGGDGATFYFTIPNQETEK